MTLNDMGNENFPLVEIISDEVLIKNTQDALDLMGEVGFTNIVLHDNNFEPNFFDLSTKKLGEVFQKFANYQIKVAILGDFKKYPSTVLTQFIKESNFVGNFLFVDNLDQVKLRWKI